MVNTNDSGNAEIYNNKVQLEKINSSEDLGTTLFKDGSCTADICIRIATATATMARLERILCSNIIRFATKDRLYKSVIVHPTLQIWDMDSACWYGEENPGICENKPEEATPNILHVPRMPHLWDTRNPSSASWSSSGMWLGKVSTAKLKGVDWSFHAGRT